MMRDRWNTRVCLVVLMLVSKSAFCENNCEILLAKLHQLSPVQFLERLGVHMGKPLRLELFDIDMNLLFITGVRISLWDSVSRREVEVSGKEFAQIARQLGRPGPYENLMTYDYLETPDGRRKPISADEKKKIEPELGKTGSPYEQAQISDGTWWQFGDSRDSEIFPRQIVLSLDGLDDWHGPAWQEFVAAVSDPERASNIGCLTVRAHSPHAIQKGFRILMDRGLIPKVIRDEMIFPALHPSLPALWGRSDYERKPVILRALAELIGAVQLSDASQRHRLIFWDDNAKVIEASALEIERLFSERPDLRLQVILHHTQRGRAPITTTINNGKSH